MATGKGILLPMPRLGMTPSGSAKLFFYQPGTTTKIDTYSTSALVAQNSNPLVADASGQFGPIFIDQAIGVKAVLYASSEVNDPPTGTPIWSQDNLYLPAVSYLFDPACDGRLTVTSLNPVFAADASAATTLYFCPYKGNRLALYDSTKTVWELVTFAEISITLVGLTAATPYDVFVYNNAGTATLELTAWSSATVRATALAGQDGTLVKSGTPTRRYLGTVYINATGGQTDDSMAKRYVWNYYHRVRRTLLKTNGTTSWTYTLATVRQANADAALQVDVMVGVAEATLHLNLDLFAENANGTSVLVAAGIGEDSTTTIAAGVTGVGASVHTGNRKQLHAQLIKMPAVGRHVYSWNEWSTATSTTTWYADIAGFSDHNGLSGSIEG